SKWEVDDTTANTKVSSARRPTSRSFGRTTKRGARSSNSKKAGEANGLPGDWGNEDDGRTLRTYIRNDQYTLRWASGNHEQSILDVPVGKQLKEEYDIGHRERLRLDTGRTEVGRRSRATRTVLRRDERPIRSNSTSHRRRFSAELTTGFGRSRSGCGANSLVACSTTTGTQLLYEGRDLFDRFRETTHRRLPSTNRSPAKDGIRAIGYVGCTGVEHGGATTHRTLSPATRWSVFMSEGFRRCTSALSKTFSANIGRSKWTRRRNFWAFRAFIDRLAHTAAEFGITVEVKPEANTRKCPECGEREDTVRSD